MPFYIGIGLETKRAYSKTHRNSNWKSIVNKTDYDIEILFDNIDYECAKNKEKEFIELYKRKKDGGLLCNLTLGGDGVLGLIHTEESKIKMSIANKGKSISDWQKQKVSDFHKGRKRLEETKNKISEAQRGEKNCRYGVEVSESTKKRMSDSSKKGEDNISSKLTKFDVLEIRKIYLTGLSSRKIAKMFKVTKGTIMSIINKKTWKHV